MHSTQPAKSAVRRFPAVLRLGLIAAVAAVAGVIGASGCLDRPLCSTPCVPQTTNVFVDKIDNTTVDKIDLLFMVDNSSSMKDKQDVLKAAVPDLVNRLVNPNCVDPNGATGQTPADPAAPCATGFQREFTAIKNIHIGVVTSSIGDHGAGGTCPDPTSSALAQEENDDKGQLVASRPRAQNLYQQPLAPDPSGFLNWNPATVANETSSQPLIDTFTLMITDADQQGCGFESQLESWYRFLVDPNPPTSIVLKPCGGGGAQQCAFSSGTNMTVVKQRAAFLRADSLLAVIMLTDENDCSIRDDQQAYLIASRTFTPPNGSSPCANNPNDPCCYNCQIGPAKGTSCAPPNQDPNCAATAVKADNGHNFNLRCYANKARFGIDFLYPTTRYVNALTQTQICTSNEDLSMPANAADCADANGDGSPDVYQNPIYTDLTMQNVRPRSPDLVFLAGIVGVPWQDIQATTDSNNVQYPAAELHYKIASVMLGDGTWDAILGNSSSSPPVLPTDHLMVESTSPRTNGPLNSGANVLVGPTNAPRFGTPGANPSNGHEWNNVAQGDLEYACAFQLAQPRDDSMATGTDCYQSDPNDFNPLCQNPDGTYGTTQYFAKGYPDLRELQVLKDFGNNSIVASLCARNLTDQGAQDYGYRPAVDAIIERLKEQLAAKCLPRVLQVDPTTHQVPCSIIEAVTTQEDCNNTPGRGPVSDLLIQPAKDRLASENSCTNDQSKSSPTLPLCSNFTFCAILPAAADCHQQTPDANDVGWCYIDPKNGDPASLVATCPATEKRLLRFVGDNTPAHGAITLIACQGAQIEDTASTATGTTPPPAGGDSGSP